MVRQVQVLKMRGNAPQPGLHTIRISTDGVRAFPRMLKPVEEAQGEVSRELISTGVAGLDEMLGGGTLRGNADPRRRSGGLGQDTVAVQFLAEGVDAGRAGRRSPSSRKPLRSTWTRPRPRHRPGGHGDAGMLEIVYVRPLDLSVDETLYAIQTAVDKVGAKRVVLDSISGLEAALAPAFKEDFSSRCTGCSARSPVRHHGPADRRGDRAVQRDAFHAARDLVPHARHRAPALLRGGGELRTFMTVVKTRARSSQSRAPRVRGDPEGDRGR